MFVRTSLNKIENGPDEEELREEDLQYLDVFLCVLFLSVGSSTHKQPKSGLISEDGLKHKLGSYQNFF